MSQTQSGISNSVFVAENRTYWQEGRLCKHLREPRQSRQQWGCDLNPFYPADTSAFPLSDQQSDTHRGFVYWSTAGMAGSGRVNSLQHHSAASQSHDQLHPRTSPTRLQQGYVCNKVTFKTALWQRYKWQQAPLNRKAQFYLSILTLYTILKLLCNVTAVIGLLFAWFKIWCPVQWWLNVLHDFNKK